MRYTGARSLDAEITLDLERGVVEMDYSLNRYSRGDGVVVPGDIRSRREKARIFITVLGIFFIYLFLGTFLAFSALLPAYLAKRFHTQYYYQKNMKFFDSAVHGIYELSAEGRLEKDQLSFLIPYNIWMDYELSGDYQEKIRKISLKRRLVKNIWWGKARRVQQGWELVFMFSEPPQSGSCLVRYV